LNLTVNHNSVIPLHSQVEQILRELIHQPEYRNGKFFPKEVDLAKRLGVSRNTVRHAANKLVMEGHLLRKKGVGTKVINKTVTTKLDSWISFAHEMQEKGLKLKTWEISSNWIIPDDEVIQFFGISKHKKVLKMCRLRGVGNGPIVYFTSYFHPRVGLTGKEDFSKPLYKMLDEEFHTVAAISKEEIKVSKSNSLVAGKLKLRKNSPILFRKRFVYDPGERPIELNYCYYNPDSFTYSIEIRRDGY
jgi:GntR family transcriptional regulator